MSKILFPNQAKTLFSAEETSYIDNPIKDFLKTTDTKTWVLSDADAPKEVLVHAYNIEPRKTQKSILLNPNVPEEILWKIIKSNSTREDDLVKVSSNRQLNAEMIDVLIAKRPDNLSIILNVVQSRNVSTKVLEHIALTSKPGFLILIFNKIFERKNAPFYLLIEYAFDENVFVQKVARRRIEKSDPARIKRAYVKHFNLDIPEENIDGIPMDWYVEMGKMLR